jgi:hypothetical protein
LSIIGLKDGTTSVNSVGKLLMSLITKASLLKGGESLLQVPDSSSNQDPTMVEVAGDHPTFG